MGKLRSWLRRLLVPQWPPGEALVAADGYRYGTRLPDGSVAFAPGIKVSRDEEVIRFLARDEIAKREQEIRRALDLRLVAWGAPPPPPDTDWRRGG
ncbi:hypothetical protein IVB45_17365 [Bradyrhizobium sp. 4]|uniref:hypothetical protein n=1 Tax=unclassified Bradyrhizobium TaxID=2631580 RepID=UPI001FFAFDED|nr:MULTISPECIES: hypothetical protein [unclassified Bradyrhizobium]MCK1402056.1 hypothetical protein [Bradyrhizobium sp. 39]MCK1751224.1 hypothetical protein [Bradyrhizobium sp. 135]UPJ38480.1 hypothetical protein IVB45_17365 [Bradyrhizobium sp. 4]